MKVKLPLRIDEAVEGIVNLDKKDKLLLSLLAEDCRMPITKIAKKVCLSKDSIIYRIKRLEQKNVILGFYPQINVDILGYSEYYLFVLLDEMKIEKKKQWLEHLSRHACVERVIEYSDRGDIEVVVLARGPKEYDCIEEELLKGYQAMILEKEINIVVATNCKDRPPKILRNGKGWKSPIKAKQTTADQVDIKILQALCEDARQSNYKIAEQVGVSSDTVRLRIKNMVQRRIITKFTVKLNLSILGYHQHSFLVDVSFINEALNKKIRAFISSSNAVVSSRKLLGYWEMRVDLLTKNQKEFHQAVVTLKKQIAPIIRNYQAWTVYKELVFNSFPKFLLE